jgi:hypothetical protein
MAGIQSGLRGLEHRLRGTSRKKVSVSKPQPPLSEPLGRGANNTATTRQSEGENRYEPRDDHGGIEQGLL